MSQLYGKRTIIATENVRKALSNPAYESRTQLHMDEDIDPIEFLERGLKKKGKTKAGLARAMGIANARVHEMLNGKRKLKLSEVPAAERYLEEALDPNGLPIGLEAELTLQLETVKQLQDALNAVLPLYGLPTEDVSKIANDIQAMIEGFRAERVASPSEQDWRLAARLLGGRSSPQ